VKKFKYLNAGSIEEAAEVLRRHGHKARVIAGGTDLLGQMQDNILPEFPEVIVNIKNIKDLEYVREENGILRIGALTRLEDISEDKTVVKYYPALAEAARRTASPHIREMGTIAGNICQSNRCWYYWAPDNRFHCLRKNGRGCYGLFGDSRYHSIFGAVRVNATPCTVKCPAGVEIPDYLQKVREGNLAEAAIILLKSNPLPAITGRVCPHYCESECNRGLLDEPVSIRCVERYLGDYILDNPGVMGGPTANPAGKRIAVVGSGPAGLSAAFYLRQMGHDVTVFESMEKAGGLLTYGIPPYRLPKDIVAKQIEAFERIGVRFKLNTKLGKDISLDDLRRNFDSVFLACGAWKERSSGIKGEPEMLSGIEFLKQINLDAREVSWKEVAVIGGGNVAIDVARVLKRLGVQPQVIYRRSQGEMPALKEEVDKAQQEGVGIRFLTQPVEVVREGNRLIVECLKMTLGARDASGRPQPIAEEGSEFNIEFDAVIKAFGEEPDISLISQEFVQAIKRLQNDPSVYLLGANVFAGGDFVSGPSTVVQAIAAGRKAAGQIDRFLGGPGTAERGKGIADLESPQKFNGIYLKKTAREQPPEITIKERLETLEIEDIGNLDLSQVDIEANRCFNCGCVAVNSSDIAPALIALDGRIKTNQRAVKAEQFFGVKGDQTTILNDAEIVLEIEVPAPGPGTRCKFIKYALRKSIDFPVINCAVAIEIREGIVENARSV